MNLTRCSEVDSVETDRLTNNQWAKRTTAESVVHNVSAWDIGCECMKKTVPIIYIDEIKFKIILMLANGTLIVSFDAR